MKNQGDEIFGRKNDNGNIDVLYAHDGERVTQFDEDLPLVYPVGSDLSAFYEHANGVEISQEDAKKIGLDVDTRVELNGHMFDTDIVVNMMDEEIRDYLHGKMAPCTEQAFLDAYMAAHLEKFGEEFIVN